MTIDTVRACYDWLQERDLADCDKDAREELYNNVYNQEDDFTIDFGSEEHRFIDMKVIDDVYQEEIQRITEECYLHGTTLDKLWWLEIDWEATAENCRKADGYGHTFATYDGMEDELYSDQEDYYVFRTN